ncbi:ankyrin [Didymella exigua CBS 183.55]|uniref:Ankyrin n=1 Tax=Didymella exigua CBS 183.55 TaxID=1150837 RepID=A0A6A5RVZ2_9PLEO|nr:ankyrin [Didymella exigua CBS 183.55]KAF1932655.1 ankyrin [Didymella exigua CBS 183.55]
MPNRIVKYSEKHPELLSTIIALSKSGRSGRISQRKSDTNSTVKINGEEEGVKPSADSTCVKANAHTAMNQLLRYEERNSTNTKRTQYSSAALQVAIRNHNYPLIRTLAQATDIHGLEPVDAGEGVLNWLDPLVATDVGSRAMTELLLKHGASIDRSLDMGLLRAPLQRAAEIDDFDIMRYLIEKGATIDTTPAYGGGTALQLAAMSGHVGIEALLIEHGADVNHLPAKGPGRTVFEAAAEWCRPDMMYFLMKHGAQLDLHITEEIGELDDAEDQDDLD